MKIVPEFKASLVTVVLLELLLQLDLLPNEPAFRGASGRQFITKFAQAAIAPGHQYQFNHQAQASHQAHPDSPKLIPLSALDRYQEGADLRLFCSASAPNSAGKLQFEWRKEGAAPGSSQAAQQQQQQLQIRQSNRVQVTQMDDSASVLRISQLEADDSANYTCFVRNQFGHDSSTVRVNVNVRLRWLKEPPSELHVRAGKPVSVECEATGQPAPVVTWSSLKDQQTSFGRILRLERAQVNDSGLYECRAIGFDGAGSSMAAGSMGAPSSGDKLRKIMRLIVNGSDANVDGQEVRLAPSHDSSVIMKIVCMK